MGLDMRTGSYGDSHVPPVSIGMPVYNGERFIREALDSLLSQTFTDFELIISDNASTDGTEAICREYAAKDHRIRYVRQPENKGQATNFNFLLQQARGEYFMWAASDDWWDKEFIKTLLEAMLTNEKCASTFCPYVFTDEYGKLISTSRVFDYSGRTRISRLLKLCFYYNDGFFYGLHKRQLVEKVRVPTWWWVNSKTPMNTAYSVLFYFLSAGDFALAGSSPLWFKRLRVHTQCPHLISYVSQRENPFLAYFAFVLRKINVLYESILSIHKGASSIIVVFVILPALIARFTYDCLQGARSYMRSALRLLAISQK